MAINNKTIETNKEAGFFVIIVKRDGVNKYIDKNWYASRGQINCTVVITKAKRFSSERVAIEFYNGIEGFNVNNTTFVKVVPLRIQYSISEEVLL